MEGTAAAFPCVRGAGVVEQFVKFGEADVREMFFVPRLTYYMDIVTHVVDAVDPADAGGGKNDSL